MIKSRFVKNFSDHAGKSSFTRAAIIFLSVNDSEKFFVAGKSSFM